MKPAIARTKRYLNCKHCEIEFVTRMPRQTFCCMKCKRLHWNGIRAAGYKEAHPNSIQLKCSTCGKEFLSRSPKRLYCSVQCRPIKHLPKAKEARKCVGCGADFSSAKVQKYCTPACRLITYKADTPFNHVTKSLRGPLGEIVVMADLIKRGYYVFRAQGPFGPFDLYAYSTSGSGLRIEVTCGRIYPSGGIGYSRHYRHLSHFDHIAVVLKDAVEYIPPLPEFK